jgi:hypothetical protein
VFHKAAVALVIVAFGAVTLLHIHHAMEGGGDLTQDYVAAMRGAHVLYPPEYKTRWNCIAPGRALDFYQANSAPPPVGLAAGYALVTSSDWQPPERISFTAHVWTSGALIALRQCYFPLWKASDAATGKPLKISPMKPDGIMAIALSRGTHTVEVSLGAPAGAILCRWVSLLALIAAVSLACRRHAE